MKQCYFSQNHYIFRSLNRFTKQTFLSLVLTYHSPLLTRSLVSLYIYSDAAAYRLNVHFPNQSQVTVLGTPAEEGDGAKLNMIDANVFANVNVAMMAHGSCVTMLKGKFSCLTP